MIRRSLPVAVVAILASLLLHGLGIGWREVQAPPPPREAPEAPETGGDFADLAQPLPEPPQPEPAEAPPPPEMTAPDDLPTTQALVASDSPQDVTAPDGPAQDAGSPADGAGPEADESARDSGADETTSDIAMIAPDEVEPAAEPPQGAEDGQPEPAEEPDLAEDTPEPEPLSPDSAEAALAPTPEAPDSVIAAEEPDLSASAVTRSLRPPATRPSAEALGVPERRQAQASRAPSYESPLTAYKRDGTDLLALGRIGNANPGDFGGSGGQGNAGTTNYAGRVLMQLNRGPRVDDTATGMARVYFQINPDGSLAWVRILESSGSANITSAAQAQVRQAAPFPRPPGGKPQKMVFVYRHR